MSKIWLDVTTILKWARPAVGIIRMEAECARFALDHPELGVAFCQFEPRKGYIRVGWHTVRKKVDEIAAIRADLGADLTQPDGADGHPQIKQRPSLPRRLTNRLATIAKVGIRNFQSLLRFVKRSAKAKSKKAKKEHIVWTAAPFPYPVCCFGKGDVYVSLGLDWDHKDLPYVAALKESRNLKPVLCCYDIIPIKFPHYCAADVAPTFARYFADVAWCAAEILCISECSKRDLQEQLTVLGAPQPTMTVVTLGSNMEGRPRAGERDNPLAATVGEKFILYVSTIERRKNHETVYRAYTRLVEEGFTDLPKLIFVGMPGWGVVDFMTDLKLDPRTQGCIEVLNRVSDIDLAWLYKNCLFTVFPSLYEGWGLPVAESLAFGKFCLASDRASIPEVGGDLIEYLDPWDVRLWAERINLYCEQPDLLRRAEERIRATYVPSTWTETGRRVFERAATLREAETPILESSLRTSARASILANEAGR